VSFEEDELERRLPNTHDWQTMSPGERQAWLLDQALDCKRDILTMPLPDPNDDSIEAHRIRMLVLAAADSTIEQTIRMQTNQLKPSAADDDMEKIFEERRLAAEAEIARLNAEPYEYGDDEPPKPN
jgi:hypothetical protein